MRKKWRNITTLIFMITFELIFSQSKIITGVVSDELGPIADINVIVKGTKKGTITDFNGNYSIKVKVGDVLVFSHMTYETKEIEVSDSAMTDVVLVVAGKSLKVVVITAQGIKKEKKSLGYAMSKVSEEQIAQKAEGDIGRILSGKTSGVRINSSSGLSGSGTRIEIRSLTNPLGNNNPLIVVDDVPINSGTKGSGRLGSSRSIDIDPNNIESVVVLKGLSAATLYGSDGRNGVILITTKNGKGGNLDKKTAITISQSYFITKMASLPEFSKRRGRGYYGLYWTYSGNWGADFGTVGQFGIDQNGNIPHPLSGVSDAFPEFNGATTPYKRYSGHKDFFDTGEVSSTSVNISGGNNKTSFNVSYGKLYDKGFIKGNQLNRDNFGIGGNIKLNNKFSVNATLNGVFTKFKTPFVRPILSNLYNMNTNYDLMNLPYQNPNDGTEIYYKLGVNPLWILNNSGSKQDVNRLFGKFQVSYDINEWLNTSYRIGLDTYTELNVHHTNKGASADILFLNDSNGRFYTDSYRNSIVDHTLMLNAKAEINKKIGLETNIGLTSKKNNNNFQYTDSYNQTNFDFFEHSNFSEHNAVSEHSQINRPAIFGQLTMDYKKYLYITGNIRNEWTSNFVNNSKLYPGLSISFIPSTAFEFKKDAIGFLKLRAAYGSSAGFKDGYPTFSSLESNSNAFNDGTNVFQSLTVPNDLANSEIKPFLISELEFGIESMLFRKRLTVDLSLYNRVTSDLIFIRPFDPATGAVSQTQNINEFKAKGIELDLGIVPIKTDNVNWKMNILFSKSTSEVTELDDDRVATVLVNNGPLGNYLILGESITTIVGSIVERDDEGNMLLESDGFTYKIDPEAKIIGDANPDYNVSLSNELNYKNLSFNMLWSFRKGGNIYSSSAAALLNRGLTTATDHLDAEATYILPGILPNGQPNNQAQDIGDIYNVMFQGGADEFKIFDGTTIRLNEISLGYSLPEKILEKTPFGNVSIVFLGQNLWYKSINFPDGLNIDTNAIGTDVSGNGSGFELASSPSSKRYGLSLKLTF